MVHFDRPAPAERIAAILDSVLEENRPENLVFKPLKTTARKTSTNIMKYQNSSRSVRSLSPGSMSGGFPKIGNVMQNKEKEKWNSKESYSRPCNLLIKLQQDHNKKKRYSTSSNPNSQGVRTPSSRPSSYTSSIALSNKMVELERRRESCRLQHSEIEPTTIGKKKVKKDKKKKKEELFTVSKAVADAQICRQAGF